MRFTLAVSAAALFVTVAAGSAEAQLRADLVSLEMPSVGIERLPAVPPLVETAQRRAGAARPLLRTLATLGAAAGGYALADEYLEPTDSDVRYGPIAAGAGASALAGMLFSTANPFRVIMGAALSTLPAAALSTFVDESMAPEERESYPLIAFSVPQGLLTSAFSQDR